MAKKIWNDPWNQKNPEKAHVRRKLIAVEVEAEAPVVLRQGWGLPAMVIGLVAQASHKHTQPKGQQIWPCEIWEPLSGSGSDAVAPDKWVLILWNDYGGSGLI